MISDNILKYLRSLEFDGDLPSSVRIMNPYKEEAVMKLCEVFYSTYYSDMNKRWLILGINPGRFGGGVTGIPFTDSKHLESHCNISYKGPMLHEVSSVFVYDMIDQYGGVTEFYSRFFIGAVCPLGLVALNESGKERNCNYYDNRELLDKLYRFIVFNLKQQVNTGIDTRVCFCLGTGSNYKILTGLNKELKLFKEIVPLEHPRFIMQYKSSQKDDYIEKYIRAFKRV